MGRRPQAQAHRGSGGVGLWGVQEGLCGGGLRSQKPPAGLDRRAACPPAEGRGGPGRRPLGFHFKLKLEAFKAHGERSSGWHTAALRPRPLPLGSRTSAAQAGRAHGGAAGAAAGRGVACDVASLFGSPPPSRPVYKTSPGDRFALADAGGGEVVGGGGASRARASSDVCPCFGGGSR